MLVRTVTVCAFFAAFSLANGQTISSAAKVPDHILYKHFFDHVAAFRTEADRMDRVGEDGNGLRFFFQKRMGLSVRENEQLQSIALDYAEELAANRQQVRAVVLASRAATMPGDRVPLGAAPPAPPAELHALFLERKLITQRAQAKLAKVLSGESIQKIDTYVHDRVAANTYRLPTPDEDSRIVERISQSK